MHFSKSVTYQLLVFVTSNYSLAKVYWPINDRFLLFSLQDTRDDGLCGDTVTTVIYHYGTQRVQTIDVHAIVGFYTLKIVALKRNWGMKIIYLTNFIGFFKIISAPSPWKALPELGVKWTIRIHMWYQTLWRHFLNLDLINYLLSIPVGIHQITFLSSPTRFLVSLGFFNSLNSNKFTALHALQLEWRSKCQLKFEPWSHFPALILLFGCSFYRVSVEVTWNSPLTLLSDHHFY